MQARSKVMLVTSAGVVIGVVAAALAIFTDVFDGDTADDFTAPSASSTSSGGDDTVGELDNPSAPDSTTSFSYTTAETVPGWSTKSAHSGCPSGWYVRLAQPDAWGDNDPIPVVHTWISSNALISETTEVTDEYGDTGLYQNIQVTYSNAVPGDSHHFNATFWCDRLPTSTPPTKAERKARSAAKVKASVGAAAESFTGSLQNVATGLYLGGPGGSGKAVMSTDPTEFWFAGDESGEWVGVDQSASYGIWYGSGADLRNSLAFPGTAPEWMGPNDGLDNGGRLVLNDYTAAPEGSMFISAASLDDIPDVGSTGSGGLCLTAAGDAGSTASLQPCDTTNTAQFWQD